jgi:Fibronectin type III domain
MVVKPYISFVLTDSDIELISDVTNIITGMTGNASYPAPSPTLPAVAAALNAFSTAYSDASGGGVALTSAKNDRRADLVALIRELASYVQVTCKGDLTVLLTSGFPIQKPVRNPIGALPAPSGLTVTFGPYTGQLSASASPVFGASVYNWRISTAAAPTVVVQSAQTTAASNTFTGLTPGVVYNVQVNAVGAAGPSDWSPPVPQMAV